MKAISVASSETLAYIAGIIDGEGSLSISRVKRSKTKSTPYGGERLQAKITISNKSRALMKFLTKVLRDLSSYRPYDFNNPLRKGQAYILEIGKLSNVVIFLETIYPYLVVKKKQSEVLMDFCKRRMKKLPKGHLNSQRKYTVEDFQSYEFIKRLNKGGDVVMRAILVAPRF